MRTTVTRGSRNTAVFMAQVVRHMSALRPFLHPRPDSALDVLMQGRPDTIGAVVWPYLCLHWDVPTRLARILGHCETVDTLAPHLKFPVHESVELLDLGAHVDGLRVVLDQPRWFVREGQLVINLFLGGERIFSLAFSLAVEDGVPMAYVGAVQGCKVDGVADEYRQITKALHGMRPRDFLFEVFRIYARALGIRRILAVNDASRHHRSAYFGKDPDRSFSLDYDEVWLDRGGVPDGGHFFRFESLSPRRDLRDVESKKRSTYRRRYELLDDIEARLGSPARSAA